jgi:methylenetetrahydrofolate dehydrogenase (NADP+)/methenyltetrahydrofolate cyclohydrolase
VEGDKASDAYTRGKKKDCEEIGLGCKHILLPNDCHYSDIHHHIIQGNFDTNCIGIILQLPLPAHLKRFTYPLIRKINPNKDVDGFLPDSTFSPCTPAGIIEILKSVKPDIAGLHCVVVGRGPTVGYPVFEMLNKLNATVTLCNSYTDPDVLQRECWYADVVITAAGVPNLITKDHVLPGTIVIDAGINRDADGKLCGDCSKDLYDYVDKITPVPGGVGLMTRAMLMKNCTYGRG